MKNNLWEVIKSIPIWKICIYIFISICLTYGTLYFLNLIYWGLDTTSLTFKTLRREFSAAYGTRKFAQLYDMFYFIFQYIFFGLYIFTCYNHAKKQYAKRYFQQILNDIRFIGEMNLDHKIMIVPDTQLGDLAKEINHIVKQLKTSIDEERHIEQTKKDLITNVSHDLRTPLTSIIGYLTYIQQDNYRDEIELRYYIEIVYDKVLRLNNLMNDLFEYTRLQNKSIQLIKNQINIVEMLDQFLVQFRIDVQQANMKIRKSLSSKQLIVLADGDKLVRVFENLIVNALKYGRDGKYIDINAREEDDLVIIDIINYGNTIPVTDLPHIFDRFYRVEKSRSMNTGGSGLGLAIAKSIVESHNGRIEVLSDAEKTIFTVKLKAFSMEV